MPPMTPTPHILIFARYPVSGKTKTRLIPALGADKAARLHRRMTEHVVAVARETRRRRVSTGHPRITVCYTGASRRDFRAWLGTDLHYQPQSKGDLGARMGAAFKQAFEDGATFTLLVGSDLPDLTPGILLKAFEKLRHHDVVLGPAHDGGYYLIGKKRLHAGLFAAMDWGTGHVYERTSDQIQHLGLRFADLPALRDMDHPEDLGRLKKDRRFEDVFTGKAMISIIIPTLNEAATIGRLLYRFQQAGDVECIVAEGGSRDATRRIAARAGACVLEVSGGRAAQQNAGANAAHGRILLFLHADTILPDGFERMIRRALDRPATVAGAFRFQTDGSGMKMRLVELMTNVRSKLFDCPYGDQGLFMEKRVFNEMGGFASLPIMEDFELVRRLRHRGRVTTLPHAAVTSARRWRQLGVIRTTVMNQIMILGFLGGVPIQRLERLYKSNQSGRKTGPMPTSPKTK
ncbi:MAG: TIGR04283 family arsenosugar biosynthesis glycosyltransferase [Deltaproteobacteria bacterium]|nr:TIGR04283 family arsenosugar biosynthesis glycosyltransferase [Deltaproteobacteria bacterium]